MIAIFNFYSGTPRTEYLHYKAVLKKLYDDGWTVKNTKGSHVQLTHPIKPGKVTLSKKYGKESLPPGTLDSIWEQAGWE